MKQALLLVGIVIFSNTLFAQDENIKRLQSESSRSVTVNVKDTASRYCKAGAVYTISLGQGSLSNWAAGGDEFTFTASTSVSAFVTCRNKKSSWDNVLNASFGYLKTSSLGSRKNDDRIDFVSKYGRVINSKLNFTTLTNFRSQAFKGYSYKETTKGTFQKKLASSFLSPAYVLVSQGLDYKPGKSLSVFVSPFTSRWVIVMNDTMSARGDYGVTPGKHSNSQVGAFATINYSKSFNKFISYNGRVDLFSNYKKNPLHTDVYMTNAVTAKVGKLVCLNWNLDMIYDEDVKLFGKNGDAPALQLRSVFGVGLQVKI